MQTRRFFWKIYPGHLIIIFFTLLFFSAVFFSALDRFYRNRTTESLEALARFTAEQVRDRLNPADSEYLNTVAARLGAQSPARITLILPDGTVAGESDKSLEQMENHRGRAEVMTAIEEGKTGQAVRFSSSVRKNMLYVAVPVYRDSALAGVVRASVPLLKIENTVREMHRGLLWSAVAVLLLSAGLSLLISRRISCPLERIKQGAERFAAGDFSYRLKAAGSSEMDSLAFTMNEMAAELEERLQTLRKERNQREAVLASMVEGVLAVDTAGRIISLNRAAAQFFNITFPETAAGRGIEEVFRNSTLQRFVDHVLTGQEASECELMVENRQTSHLQVRGTALLGPQERRIGAVIVFNDVSRLRRLENLRRDFVANVSHELKTPITSIKGFAETLLDGALKNPEEAERFLKIIARHADRLNSIIEDLLMLSRLEQDGKEGMSLETADINGILQSAVDVCSPRVAAKKIAITVSCPAGLTASVNRPLIEQAMINLISNAIKYSADEKEVKVSAQAADGGVLLQVQDHGIGIETKHLDRLFERFYRVDKGRSRHEGGTGLGLSIVKHIAQAHGGTVSVQSRYGEGSVFSIFLPSV